jgi:glycosyltransferase involved in cell wall biosynthesis
MLTVIVPIYNEKKNIPLLYDKVKAALDKIGEPWEIILINDGSTDGSFDELNHIALADFNVKIIHFQRNFGQTAAIMAGIDFAQGNIIIPMDGDLQNDPEDIPKLLEKLDEGYDVVSGWRKDRKDNPIKRNLPSKIANTLISGVSKVKLHDYGCSLKAYKSNFVKGVKLYGEMHRFIPIYATWLGAKVAEVPVNHYPRKFGKSKYGINRTFKVILDLIVVKFLQKYAQKPIYIFGGFGLFCFLGAFLTFLVMLYFKFWGGKSFIQTPLPFLVILLCVIGIQSIFMGLIAEVLNRTYHESQNKPVYLIKECKNINRKS